MIETRNEESLDQLYERINKPRSTPRTTIEAIMHADRTRGRAALREPATKDRLSRCDRAARAEIRQRILAWEARHAA